MRKLLLMMGAATLLVGTPVAAKGGGGKPDKQQGGGGGGKPQKAQQGGGGRGAQKEFKQVSNAQPVFLREERRRDRVAKPKKASQASTSWARAEGKRDKQLGKAEKKTWKAVNKREGSYGERYRREAQEVRFGDRNLDRARYFNERGSSGGCPPGLANKGNGCLPPGQANKLFAVGQVLPAAYYGSYNVPSEYQDWYQDSSDYRYRYDDSGYIYGVNGRSGLIESLIPLLGGGFGVGESLPAGYDTYNLPLSYRDDFADSDEATYRYGDEAIYQVDPQSQMIEAVVALLGGDLNVGQALPAGYDTYNLPMEYRDQYQDSDEAMYRYGDGSIYQVDPQSMIIEQIVAQLT